MEDISFGERIKSFTVEGKTPQGWIWLTSGSCIGHKFIARTKETTISSVRLTIHEQRNVPIIRDFSVYHVAKSP